MNLAKTQRKQTKTILSPLRYPGSKRRLAKYIDEVLQANSLQPDLFIEIFAGGASVSLQLLNDCTVQQIGLVEKDPLVAAFWKVVFSKNDVDWLISQISEMEITVKKWQEFKNTVPVDQRTRALACLYLNRTSFSGILAPSSGPLGGHEQKSDYLIDCRFPRETLIKRIQQANALRDKVAFIWQADWAVGLKRIFQRQEGGKLPPNAFFYFDPPFYNKAKKLYNFYFNKSDHAKLRDAVVSLKQKWVLSYDYCDQVEELYAGNNSTHIEMLYSAAQNGGPRAAKEVILTNLPTVPINRKLWRTAEECRNGRSANNGSMNHT